MIKEKRKFYVYLRKLNNYKMVCALESLYLQHGNTTVYKHCRNVAYCSLIIASKLEKKFNIKFNYKNLIIGAFLHDLFLYDWHVKDRSHRLHGYKHPIIASKNATEICNVNEDIRKIIESHMWPLTITRVPQSKEAFIVCMIDKYLALKETFKIS